VPNRETALAEPWAATASVACNTSAADCGPSHPPVGEKASRIGRRCSTGRWQAWQGRGGRRGYRPGHADNSSASRGRLHLHTSWIVQEQIFVLVLDESMSRWELACQAPAIPTTRS
jgi:hypothetical protein